MESELNLSVDLLLAHAVVAPTLKRHASDLYRWRFHRRAARDNAGHQFSFLFYSGPDVASNVIQGLKQNDILVQSLTKNIIETMNCSQPNMHVITKIEDTSDPQWSETLQKNWPSYIMGVSALWLGLIDDAMAEIPDNNNVSVLLEQYEEADTKITSIWKNEGQHALLHHLSAIFGYEPLWIKQEIRF